MIQRSLLLLVLLAGPLLLPACQSRPDTVREQAARDSAAVAPYETDVPYVATPQPVVERMLEMADLTEDDVVYDLGSGDGRFVLTAVQQFDVKRAVGVEIVPELVRTARETASLAGVTDRVEFRRQDFFETDLSDATVVVMYLLPEVMAELKPKLLRELDAGDRLVAHDYVFAGWPPEARDTLNGHRLYRWTIPAAIPDSLYAVPDSLDPLDAARTLR